MVPNKPVRAPEAFTIAATSEVVVVFPFVPVTATSCNALPGWPKKFAAAVAGDLDRSFQRFFPPGGGMSHLFFSAQCHLHPNACASVSAWRSLPLVPRIAPSASPLAAPSFPPQALDLLQDRCQPKGDPAPVSNTPPSLPAWSFPRSPARGCRRLHPPPLSLQVLDLSYPSHLSRRARLGVGPVGQ